MMSDESSPTRTYRLKKRADKMVETRQRIAEAAAELHGTVGPANTTFSAVAQRAGVQRQTVYRHFPTETDLFGACSAHFFNENPLPDLEAWREIQDPSQRLELALNELYAYYQRTEQMLSNVLRDAELLEALQPTLVPMQSFLAEAAELLAAGRGARGRRRHILETATRHAVDFRAWQSLAGGNRITRDEAIGLAGALIEAAAR